MPRHPPNALLTLDRSHCQYRPLKARIGSFIFRHAFVPHQIPEGIRQAGTRRAFPRSNAQKVVRLFGQALRPEAKTCQTSFSRRVWWRAVRQRQSSRSASTRCPMPCRPHGRNQGMRTIKSLADQSPDKPAKAKPLPVSGHDLLFTMQTQQAPAKPAQTELPIKDDGTQSEAPCASQARIARRPLPAAPAERRPEGPLARERKQWWS